MFFANVKSQTFVITKQQELEYVHELARSRLVSNVKRCN